MRRRNAIRRLAVIGSGLFLFIAIASLRSVRAQQSGVNVSGQIAVQDVGKGRKVQDLSGRVVWLAPLDSDPPLEASRFGPQPFRLVQKSKSFQPHLLIVPVGAVVDFPNEDPFFHNVFSLFNGKRFDLGLYEAGTARRVKFDRPGVCYIFCNIHSEMSAVVIVLATNYYGISDAHGAVAIHDVPPGRYKLQVWDERSDPRTLENLAHAVNIAGDSSALGTIRLQENSIGAHKNKYDQDYSSPAPPNSIYVQP